MKILSVRRNRPNIFRIGKAVFYPGVSEIHGEKLIEAVRAHKSYKALIKNGVMEEVTSKTVDKKDVTTDVTEMNARDAIRVIRETYAIPVLQDMHQRETDNKARSSVLAAVLDQIEEIKKPPEKSKDGDRD